MTERLCGGLVVVAFFLGCGWTVYDVYRRRRNQRQQRR